MNLNFNSTSGQRWQLSANDCGRRQFEEMGQHILWQRPTEPSKALDKPFTAILWPARLALDKIERAISSNIFWQVIGRFDRLGTSGVVECHKIMTLAKLKAKLFRVQHNTSHLTKYQRDQRISLLSWLVTDHQTRYENCQEQWRYLDLSKTINTSKSVRPQWIVKPAVARYLERVKGWIENAYDQGKLPQFLPRPFGLPSSALLGDMAIGVKILSSSLEVRTTELALAKYIKRCNWGRCIVKLSIIAPVVSLIGRKILHLQLPGLLFSAAGVTSALCIWLFSFYMYWKEVQRNLELVSRIIQLATDLTLSEDAERNQEIEEAHFEKAKELYRNQCQQAQERQEKEAQAASETNAAHEQILKCEALRREIAKEREKLDAANKATEALEKSNESMKEQLRGLGILIDYSLGFPRLAYPLRITET